MRVDDLERDLRAERPEPSLDFARRLDEWAEAGFPPDSGLGPHVGTRAGTLRRAWGRISTAPPRRMLMPAGAIATAVVVAGVAFSQSSSDPSGLSAPAPTRSETTVESAQGAESAQQAPSAGGVQGASGAGQGPAPEADQASPGGASTDGYDLTLPDSGSGFGSGGGIARGTDERIVDASARITLGAGADEVQDVANGVVDVTDRYDGVVLDSQVTTDQAGARAAFELEIPYPRLDAALADLSGLADVISRTEGGEDITAHAVRARKQLADTLDQLRAARVELIGAETREQRLVAKSRIASLEANTDAQRAELNGVKRQGRFATVGVDVTSNGPAGDGGWSLGDALDDSTRVLEVIGGIALVSLAILLPISLLAALVAFILTRTRRRARESALDYSS